MSSHSIGSVSVVIGHTQVRIAGLERDLIIAKYAKAKHRYIAAMLRLGVNMDDWDEKVGGLSLEEHIAQYDDMKAKPYGGTLTIQLAIDHLDRCTAAAEHLARLRRSLATNDYTYED